MSKVKVGPFTWERLDDKEENDRARQECWELVVPEDSGLSFFYVKNYGGAPSASAFSGWRLGSGGPFTQAGGWTSRTEAMKGAVPFLIKFFRAEAERKMKGALRTKAVLDAFLKELQ